MMRLEVAVARRKTVRLFDAKPDPDEGSGLDRERLQADAKAFADANHRGDEVDEASAESFPASDAPSFTSTTRLGGSKQADSD